MEKKPLTRTKKFTLTYWIFEALSILASLLPLSIYTIKGFAENDGSAQQVGLVCSISVAIILFLVNVILKYNLKSPLWIMTLGLYFCLDNILPLIIILAITTILDEFVFTPCKKIFKERMIINKEIDKRMDNA